MKQENIEKSKLHKVLKLYPLLQAEDTTRRINHVDYHSDNSNLLHIKSVLDDAIAALPMKYRILILLLFVEDVKPEKIQSMLGMNWRIDLYRRLSTAFEIMLEKIGNIESLVL